MIHKDHPRVGGEKLRIFEHPHTAEGSPPRGRGKEDKPALILRVVRITPAWAGKRYDQLGRRAKGQDHPRVGGEKTKKIP